MPTHPIGPGTCNLSVNVRKGVRLDLGRLAFGLDMSMGELVRRMLACAAPVLRVPQIAREAEQNCIAALTELRLAMAPESEGGETVTPEEASRISFHINDAAGLSREINHQLIRVQSKESAA